MAEIGEPLSDRELAVLECLVDGSTNREIAQSLHISHNTVKVHLRNIFTKLDVNSRTEATAVALQMGLLSLPGLETTDDSETEENDTSGAEPGGSAETEPVTPATTAKPIQSDTAQPITSPVSKAQSSRRWRIVSLTLGGLLLLLLLLLIASQFLDNGLFGAAGEQEPVEEQIGETRWFITPPLPQPVSNMALAAVGLNLYQIGGEVEAGPVNLVNIYETDTGEWRSGAAKPTAVADTTAAVLFGEVFVVGGRLADDRPTSVVEAYSPANDAWRPITALPTPVAGGLALTNGSSLYFFGGWDGSNYLTEAYIYDLNTDMWQALPPMPTGRAFAAGALLSGKLYIVGGQNEQGELAVCEFFDLETAAWSACPDMNQPRAGAGAAALANKLLYIIGGGAETETLTSEVYDPNELNAWQPVEMPMLNNQSWHHMAVANIETRIFVFGGRQGETILDQGYVFSPFVYETFLPAVGADE